jgi:hypothetical protein
VAEFVGRIVGLVVDVLILKQTTNVNHVTLAEGGTLKKNKERETMQILSPTTMRSFERADREGNAKRDSRLWNMETVEIY